MLGGQLGNILEVAIGLALLFAVLRQRGASRLWGIQNFW